MGALFCKKVEPRELEDPLLCSSIAIAFEEYNTERLIVKTLSIELDMRIYPETLELWHIEGKTYGIRLSLFNKAPCILKFYVFPEELLNAQGKKTLRLQPISPEQTIEISEHNELIEISDLHFEVPSPINLIKYSAKQRVPLVFLIFQQGTDWKSFSQTYYFKLTGGKSNLSAEFIKQRITIKGKEYEILPVQSISTCRICRKQQSTHLSLPCKDLCICTECAGAYRIESCPACGNPLSSISRIN